MPFLILSKQSVRFHKEDYRPLQSTAQNVQTKNTLLHEN